MQKANLTYRKQCKQSKYCELPLFVGKATVNNILVDGISFIEKLSFNPFSEGKRLKHCTTLHKRLFGVEVKKIGEDTGYASTKNRDFCKENGIQTSFVKRGRPFSEEKKGERPC